MGAVATSTERGVSVCVDSLSCSNADSDSGLLVWGQDLAALTGIQVMLRCCFEEQGLGVFRIVSSAWSNLVAQSVNK